MLVPLDAGGGNGRAAVDQWGLCHRLCQRQPHPPVFEHDAKEAVLLRRGEIQLPRLEAIGHPDPLNRATMPARKGARPIASIIFHAPLAIADARPSN